jgi:DNA-binding MarR family transcriptional regulator
MKYDNYSALLSEWNPAENWFAWFGDAEKALFRSADGKLRSLVGVSFAQSKVIAFLAHGQSMTLVELANQLGSDTGALSRLVSRLAAGGVVAKTRHAQDNRSRSIALTEHGLTMAEEAAAILKELDAQLLGERNDDGPRFVTLLNRVLSNSSVSKAVFGSEHCEVSP